MDEVLAIAVMEDQPSIIKRPILDTGKERVLGFDEERYQRLFLH
jgi:arsenate reductase-like glutaredoxin family protein